MCVCPQPITVKLACSVVIDQITWGGPSINQLLSGNSLARVVSLDMMWWRIIQVL